MVPLGVLLLLAGIVVLALRGPRKATPFAVAGLAVLVVGGLRFSGFAPQVGESGLTPPDSDFTVEAAATGGWKVDVPEVEGARRYVVAIDGRVAGTFEEPGEHVVADRGWASGRYGPRPLRQVKITARSGKDVLSVATAQGCAPVVFLSARGTNENPPAAKYAEGVGSRGWRTWHYLAEQLGVSPREAGQEPTVVQAVPVRYPAIAIGTEGTYVSSRNKGVQDLVDAWSEVRRSCPDTMVVAFGYSQGADVVASVWQNSDIDTTNTSGVVLFADPHFSKSWVDQGIVLPEAGVYKHNGMLGARPEFADSRLAGLQAWCWPADPVCQAPSLNDWHGPAYDCYEEWAAYFLAGDLRPFLRDQGYTVPPGRVPACSLDARGR